MISQHWFTWWLGAVTKQAIIWASIDPGLCRQLVSLCHKESTHWGLNKIVAVSQTTFSNAFIYSMGNGLYINSSFTEVDPEGAVRKRWAVVEVMALQWRNNERDDISNHRSIDCLLNRFLLRRPMKISKVRVTSLYEGTPPVTGGFPSLRASNAENASIWWRHHGLVPSGRH